MFWKILQEAFSLGGLGKILVGIDEEIDEVSSVHERKRYKSFDI